ncbi:MAG: hypothetical protein DRJ96_10070 [Thermoprotei archaeon]|nr:hypothetical protein [Thermoproteales archaeon]RLE93457.1 MAG: hypothetical protein DRJ96_10070 [Thermoprotei archaeon]
MSRSWVIYLLLLPPLAALALAQVTYTIGPLELTISEAGMVNVYLEGVNVGTGSLMNWGPGWKWEDACSWEDSWSVVGTPSADEVTFEVECYAKCSYAELRPRLKYWMGLEAVLLEVNVTAEGDSEFAGMSWTLQIPISRFAGERIYVVLTNGSWVEVELREEHVPGNFSLVTLNGVACWVIPMGNDSGLVYSVLTDLWPQGISIAVEDEREWGGNTYALRNWISQYFSLYKGQLIRVLVYLRAYTGDPGPAVNQVLAYTERVAMGESLSTLKRAIIEELNLEEARAARSNPVTTYMLAAFFAFTALLALLILYYFLRTRGRRQAI